MRHSFTQNDGPRESSVGLTGFNVSSVYGFNITSVYHSVRVKGSPTAKLSVRRMQGGTRSSHTEWVIITSTIAIYLEPAYTRNHAIYKSSTAACFNQLSTSMYENWELYSSCLNNHRVIYWEDPMPVSRILSDTTDLP